MKSRIAAILAMAGMHTALAQLTVTSPVADTTLAGAITGAGISVSNITNNGVTPTAMGTFSCVGPCNLGLSGGIILTSGNAVIAAAPNTGTGQGAAINNLSDPQLNTLTIGITRDACVLEFDFQAASDSVRFDYVFGSDEYDDYVNSQFNDVFGFFISGPGISGSKNMALIPGTSAPVAINSVNNGGPYMHGVTPTGPCNNCAYYVSNTNPPNLKSTAYDGVTTVLTAMTGNLQPGAVYHLKLAISDVGDQIFDSGTLIGEGSFFITGPVWLYHNGQHLAADTVSICSGGSGILSGPPGFSYLWNTGATTQTITVSTAGTYSLTVTGSNPSMPAFSDPVVFIVDTLSIAMPVISQNGNQLVSSLSGPGYSYAWTLNGLVLPSSNAPQYSFSLAGCYTVQVTSVNGCFAESDTFCVNPTFVAESSTEGGMLIAPNPAIEGFTITAIGATSHPIDLFVVDSHGKTVLELKSVVYFPVTVDVAAWPSGIYQVVMSDNAHYRFLERLLVL